MSDLFGCLYKSDACKCESVCAETAGVFMCTIGWPIIKPNTVADKIGDASG